MPRFSLRQRVLQIWRHNLQYVLVSGIFTVISAIQMGQILTLHARVYQLHSMPLPTYSTPVSQKIPFPIKVGPPPVLTARNVYVFSPETGSVLYEQLADITVPQASLTKLMTALVTIESYPLDEIITVTNEASTEGNTVKLKVGEQMTVYKLLQALLIFSGNDAAVALANHYQGGSPAFIQRMNARALELHMYQTSYQNPAGLDHPQQFSTARDLAILSAYVLENPTLKEILGTAYAQVESEDKRFRHSIYTTNQLLGKFDGVVAGKTGSTDLAGECLVTQNTRDDRTIITVILGSSQRFVDTKLLTEWIYAQYQWQIPPEF